MMVASEMHDLGIAILKSWRRVIERCEDEKGEEALAIVPVTYFKGRQVRWRHLQT